MMSPKVIDTSTSHATRWDAGNDAGNNMDKDDNETGAKGSGSEEEYEYVSSGESEDCIFFMSGSLFWCFLMMVLCAHVWVIMLYV